MTIMAKTAYRGATIASLRNLSVYRDNAAEYALAASEAAEGSDLLSLVPDQDPDLRTEGQARYMEDLIADLAKLDASIGRQAREYTDSMTEQGRWTPGRGGNASVWIDRMLSKIKELRAAQARTVTPNITMIAPGNYAITDDEVRCYSIKYGREGTRWEGFLFLARISSDNEFPIKNRAEKARILEAIGANVEAASILAGITLRKCRRCGRTLSDTKNPYFLMALGPECGSK
jgi:hypothetical protein